MYAARRPPLRQAPGVDRLRDGGRSRSLLGLLLGSTPNRAVSVGFYLVGCALLLGGFFVGNRGPFRVANEEGMVGLRVPTRPADRLRRRAGGVVQPDRAARRRRGRAPRPRRGRRLECEAPVERRRASSEPLRSRPQRSGPRSRLTASSSALERRLLDAHLARCAACRCFAELVAAHRGGAAGRRGSSSRRVSSRCRPRRCAAPPMRGSAPLARSQRSARWRSASPRRRRCRRTAERPRGTAVAPGAPSGRGGGAAARSGCSGTRRCSPRRATPTGPRAAFGTRPA